MSSTLNPDANMAFEIGRHIIAKDDKGDDWSMEAHALEACHGEEARIMNQATMIELGYRRAFHAIRAAKKLRGMTHKKHGSSGARNAGGNIR